MSDSKHKHFRSTVFKYRSLSWDYNRRRWSVEWDPRSGYLFTDPVNDWEALRKSTPDLIEQAEAAGFSANGPVEKKVKGEMDGSTYPSPPFKTTL